MMLVKMAYFKGNSYSRIHILRYALGWNTVGGFFFLTHFNFCLLPDTFFYHVIFTINRAVLWELNRQQPLSETVIQGQAKGLDVELWNRGGAGDRQRWLCISEKGSGGTDQWVAEYMTADDIFRVEGILHIARSPSGLFPGSQYEDTYQLYDYLTSLCLWKTLRFLEEKSPKHPLGSSLLFAVQPSAPYRSLWYFISWRKRFFSA